MVFEVTLTNVITMLALVIAAMWALFKRVSVQQERAMALRFDALTVSMNEVARAQQNDANATAELEREFLKHQVAMARDYVRRDDFVQVIGTINTRFDNFALRVEAAVLNRNAGANP